jgi:hypothetical protein
MRKLFSVLIIAALAAPLGAAEDVTGKWSGKFTFVTDGQKQQTDVYAVLTQKGAELTGTIGPEERVQWSITKGKIETTKDVVVVVFSAAYAKRDVSFTSTYDLRLVKGRLVGKAKIVSEGKTTEADMDMQRVSK